MGRKKGAINCANSGSFVCATQKRSAVDFDRINTAQSCRVSQLENDVAAFCVFSSY